MSLNAEPSIATLDPSVASTVLASDDASGSRADQTESHEDKNKTAPGAIPCEGGGTVTIRYDVKEFKDTYLDEYTREVIPHHLVRAAIRDELDYFNSNVWKLSDAKNVLSDSDSKVIRTRWVICNKGDAQTPDVRARLVACELNTYRSDDCVASALPLEAKRLLLSQLATERKAQEGGRA